MKKYWQFFKMNFEYFFEYRVDLLVSFIIKLIVFLAFIFLWKAIDNEGKSIQRYGFSGLMFYYLVIAILAGFATSQTAKDIRTDILQGHLSAKLVKPFSLYSHFLTRQWARVLSETILNLCLALPILFIWRDISSEAFLNVMSIFRFICTSLLASLLVFNVYFLVGISAFWTKEAFGIQMVVRNASRFFTGALIPLDLLPQWFQDITEKLPFGYMLYYPAKLLMEDVHSSEYLYSVSIILFWICIFFISIFFVWRKGLKQYESVGI